MQKLTHHFSWSASIVRLIVCGSTLAVGLWLPSAAAQAAPTGPDNPMGELIRSSRAIGSPMRRIDNTLPPASSIAVSDQLQPGVVFPGSLDALNGSGEQRGENVPPRVPRVAGDENWSGLFGLPGTNNYVNAVAVDGGGTLYAGGIFTATGGIPANYVAKWNESSSWSALGTGVNSYVDALLVDGYGNLYAGGNFTTAGGATVNHIAMWNEYGWSALGNGLNGAVFALAVDGSGYLYAGGWFTQICGNAACNSGNSAASYIARWNGSSWSALGSGVNGYVWALAVNGSNLYAGGEFTTAGGTTANNVAMWNGSSWSALGYGLDSIVFGLALDASGNVYAGGAFTLKCSNAACSSGTTANHVAKWNGSSWSGIGSASMNSDVYALKVDASGNLFVAGDFSYSNVHYIAEYNGTWSNLGSGMNWDVLGLALDGAGNLYAGGYFATAGGRSVNYVAKWNGSNWSALGSGMDDKVHDLVVDGSGNLYAGGDFVTAGGTTVNHIAKWNGSAWSALGSGMNFPVYALAVDAGGNLYAGGQFITAGGATANRVAMWNGSNWAAVGNGVSGYVYALAVSNGALYAGGSFTQLCGNDACNSGNTVANHVAKWNASSWYPLDYGMNHNVYALAADGSGNVFAGGYFTQVCGTIDCNSGNTTVNYVAKWNVKGWQPVGGGVSGYASGVYALTVDGSANLYAGGYFSTAGGQTVNSVAKWSGSSWSALGSGVNYSVLSLAAAGSGKLYIGGVFTTAGGKASSRIAQWSIPASVPSFRIYLPLIVR